jgi:hypothetical protein
MMTIRYVIADSDQDRVARILNANRPDAGVVTCQVAPEMRRTHAAVTDLLRMFGCRDDVAGAGRNTDRDSEAVIAWLLADQITDVVLVDVQWMHPSLLADVFGIVAAANAALWLVAHEPIADSWATHLAGWPLTPTDQDELDTFIQNVPPPPEPPERSSGLFPRVVDAPWVVFRAENRDHLSADEFKLFDAVFVDAVQTGIDTLTAGTPSEEMVLEYLAGRCNARATYDEVLVEVRAAQVAAWRTGWHLQVLIPQFAAATRLSPTIAQMQRRDWWDRLAVYPHPWRAAVCAYTAAQLGCDTIIELTVADANPDGSSNRAAIPAAARRYVRAQRLIRIAQGADARDPLFVGDTGAAIGSRRAAQALLDAAVDCGVNLIGGRVPRKDTTGLMWANRNGISVQPLARKAQR